VPVDAPSSLPRLRRCRIKLIMGCGDSSNNNTGELGMLPTSSDVIVIGAGNAAFCAALAAAEHGVSVLVLERAPQDETGGNSRFTAGAFR
jgi:heterodisulfide reductase subunit A-like polyferredoxin